MGENHFAPTTLAVYGGVLLGSAVAYFVLQNTIIAVNGGPASPLARALEQNWKGMLSPVLCSTWRASSAASGCPGWRARPTWPWPSCGWCPTRASSARWPPRTRTSGPAGAPAGDSRDIQYLAPAGATVLAPPPCAHAYKNSRYSTVAGPAPGPRHGLPTQSRGPARRCCGGWPRRLPENSSGRPVTGQ